MRIIIESTERGGLEIQSIEPIQPSHIETMDGGSPSTTLIQAIAEASPISTEGEAIEAGLPPEWLLEAIQGAMPFSTEGSSMDTDAGSALSSEG